jgi:hypothetical protein
VFYFLVSNSDCLRIMHKAIGKKTRNKTRMKRLCVSAANSPLKEDEWLAVFVMWSISFVFASTLL